MDKKFTSDPAYFKIEGDALIRYFGKDEEIVAVPEGITEIKRHAFANSQQIKYVHLPSTLKKISDCAFAACPELKIAIIPDSVESLGDSAFYNCISLQAVQIGKGIKVIGTCTFRYCTALTSVVLSDGLIEIGRTAFEGCAALDKIALPRTLKKIGIGAFSDCRALPSGFVIPASVTEICASAFSGCNVNSFKVEKGSIFHMDGGCMIDTANKKLISGCISSKIPEDGSVTCIASDAFNGYPSHGVEITVPLAVTEIEANGFSYCRGLTIKCKADNKPKGWHEQWYTHDEWYEEDCYDEEEVKSNEIKIIWGCMTDDERADLEQKQREREAEEELFRQAQLHDFIHENGILTQYIGKGGDIIIPDDVSHIRAHAFDDCQNISSVKIHYFVVRIESGAFAHFENAVFYCQSQTCPVGFEDGWRAVNSVLELDCVNNEEREQIKEECYLRRIAELAKEGFEVECGKIVSYNGNASSLIIPDDIQAISRDAFKNNTNLTSINFNNVEKIEDYAFENCPELAQVIFTDKMNYIFSSAFRDCKKLSGVVFPRSIHIIHQLAFSATDLQTVSTAAAFIGNYAFADCENLKEVTLDSSSQNVTVRWGAFQNCPKLKSVAFDCKCDEIEWETFCGCKSLESVTLPRNVEKIGNKAFLDCEKLFSIDLPETLTEIGASMFENCKSLSEVSIPNSVEIIGDNAFAGCTGLKAVSINFKFKKEIDRIFGEIDRAVIKFKL